MSKKRKKDKEQTTLYLWLVSVTSVEDSFLIGLTATFSASAREAVDDHIKPAIKLCKHHLLEASGGTYDEFDVSNVSVLHPEKNDSTAILTLSVLFDGENADFEFMITATKTTPGLNLMDDILTGQLPSAMGDD